MTASHPPSDGDHHGEERQLLSEQIRLALTDEIAGGRLKPGALLDEQQIADRFGASRTPVREALRQLSVAGLVEIRPRRGVVVAPLTVDKLNDLFELTAEVEAMCVRLATYRLTAADRSQLQAIHQRSRALVADRDVERYDAANLSFHETLYHATHNRAMAEEALAVRTRLVAFRRTQLRYGDRITRSFDEHEEVLRAMWRGDGDEAARCMRAHMMSAAGALITYIREIQQDCGAVLPPSDYFANS